MDRNVHQTNTSLRLGTEAIVDANRTSTATALFEPLLLNVSSHGLRTNWTLPIIVHLTTVSLLMSLTLIGNAVVIVTITSCAELRKKRVNVFILNLIFFCLLFLFLLFVVFLAFSFIHSFFTLLRFFAYLFFLFLFFLFLNL